MIKIELYIPATENLYKPWQYQRITAFNKYLTYCTHIQSYDDMSACIVNIEFTHDTSNYIFAKKIFVCGLTRNKHFFSQVIKYPYPACDNDENPSSDTKKIGNIICRRCDHELTKILKTYDTIIVQNAREKEFITHYTASQSCRIIDIQNNIDDCKERNEG